jgi:hypothetical protein
LVFEANTVIKAPTDMDANQDLNGAPILGSVGIKSLPNGEPTIGTGRGMREHKVLCPWHQGMRGGGKKFAALVSSKDSIYPGSHTETSALLTSP